MADILDISWFSKYQPRKIEDYVFDDPTHEDLVKTWLENGVIAGNLLLSGSGGIGKSSLAALLINNIVKSPHDLKRVRSRSVNEVDELESFVKARPATSKKKVILFEEIDKISNAAMSTMKDGLLENYQNNATFIATTNYPNKIDPAFKTRFMHLSFEGKNIDGIINRCKQILILENIIFDEEQLKSFIQNKHKLGLRNLITILQVNSVNKKIDFTQIDQDITTNEEDIVNNTLKIFEILLNSDIQNKKLILLSPLQSNIQPQYSHILEVIQFSTDMYWDNVFIQINEKVHFLPVKMLCSKYLETVDNKKMPHLHFLAFLYDSIKIIIELF